MTLKPCPRCNSVNTIQLGDNYACMDCDWDDLPVIETETVDHTEGCYSSGIVVNLESNNPNDYYEVVPESLTPYPSREIISTEGDSSDNYLYFPPENLPSARRAINLRVFFRPVLAYRRITNRR